MKKREKKTDTTNCKCEIWSKAKKKNRKNKQQFKFKKMKSECNDVGPNMSYLSKMYNFRFSSINLVNFSYTHLLKYLP